MKIFKTSIFDFKYWFKLGVKFLVTMGGYVSYYAPS